MSGSDKSILDAFREAHEASGGACDDVDAAEYVRRVRGECRAPEEAPVDQEQAGEPVGALSPCPTDGPSPGVSSGALRTFCVVHGPGVKTDAHGLCLRLRPDGSLCLLLATGPWARVAVEALNVERSLRRLCADEGTPVEEQSREPMDIALWAHEHVSDLRTEAERLKARRPVECGTCGATGYTLRTAHMETRCPDCGHDGAPPGWRWDR